MHNRVEGLEERIAALECNNDHNTGTMDTVRAEIQGVKQTINSEVQKRLETLENKDRQLNIKLLNLPENPWETTESLQTKAHEVLSHISPVFPASHFHEVRRLGGRGVMKQRQAHQDATRSTLADASNASSGPPPVLIKLSNHSEVQSILKVGNNKINSYVNSNICIVDDESKITLEKRKQLIPKMKQLRDA